MDFWVIDEAENFIVLSCCSYAYYKETIEPPWGLEAEEEME